MPPKRRARGSDDATSEENKRMRSAIDEVAEEWVCPITHELPADPVMAEDGHIYERVAIEELIDRQGAGLKSPLTNETMGPKLMPSVQVRATIEKLVRTGAIEGDKADKWQQRLKEAEEVTELRQRAEGGDVCAMHELGIWIYKGDRGLPQNKKTSYSWLKRAADLHHPPSLAVAGAALLDGLGCTANVPLGLGLIFRAAEAGSEVAACALGEWYSEESNDLLPKDVEQAKYWLGKVVAGTCHYKDQMERKRSEMATLLATL